MSLHAILLSLEKFTTEAYQTVEQAFKKGAMSYTQVFQLHGHFKCGEMSVEDHVHSGHPSSSENNENIEKIHQKIK